MDQYLPFGVGSVSAVAASMLDINYGAIAGGITLIATAAGAAYWQFSQKRLAVMRDESAAKMQILREESVAMMEIQKLRDEANRESLSAQLGQISGQLGSVQLTLDDAREANASLKIRIEDANRKLHQVNNDQQARELRHAAEKMELEQKYAEIVAKLDAEHAENVALLDRIGRKADDTWAKADDNSARLDALEGP